jgi:ubiquinone/menaquinone biosynthesis C-methylase UbiE
LDLLRNTRKFDPELLELMDRPDPSTAELARALINLQKLNRHFGSYRIIRHFLNRWIKPGETVTILDACTGFGDIPRLLVEWARRRGSKVKVLAVDMQSATLEIAQQRSALFPEISFAQADIRSFETGDRFDIVLCSLALHHFGWQEAVDILQRLSRLSRRAVLISDLARSITGILGVYLLT